MADPYVTRLRQEFGVASAIGNPKAHAKLTGITGDGPVRSRVGPYIGMWLGAQHRACHTAPRYVFQLPDRDEVACRCLNCGWGMNVSRVQWVRWCG